MKRHISIFAFLLGAFAAAGLVPSADAETATITITSRGYWEPGKTPNFMNLMDDKPDVISPESVTKSVSYGDTIRFTAKPPTAGYAVDGWYQDDDAFMDSPDLIDGTAGKLVIDWTYTGTGTTTPNVYLGILFRYLKYNVKYDENGGSSVSDKSTISYETSFNLAAAPSKTGYTFSGWKDINGSGTSWAAEASVKGSSFSELNDVHVDNHDVTLKAQWTANKYTVTFDGNDGGSPSPGSKTVTYGKTYGDLATCSRTGYTFDGWWTAASGGTKIETTTTVTITGAQTLYAHWAAGTYTVTFNANGGDTPSPTTKSVTYGLTYGTLATCTRTGYTFDGWWTAASGGTKVVTTTPVTITAAQTLYAHWTPVSYTITYTGYKAAHSNPTTYTIETPTITFNPPTEVAGYKFNGWDPPSIAKGSTGNVTVRASYLSIAYKPDVVSPKTYNGYSQTCAQPGTGVVAEGNQAKDVGTYTAKFTPISGYCWSDGTVEPYVAEWKIVNAEMENVTAYQTGSLTYTGEPQQPTVYTRADVKGSTPATWKYSTSAGGYAATLPSFTDAGKYTVYYEVTAPGHNPKTGSFDVVVNRARTAEVVLSQTQFSYTGREQGPDVTFTHCTEASGSVRKATEVGTYYVKATPDANYAWGDGGTETRDFEWRIVEGSFTAIISTGEGGSGGSTFTYRTSQNQQAQQIKLPTRTGYQLTQWTASGYEGEPPTISGTTLTIPARTAGDFTMIPTWEPITYTIDFDGNGGTGEMEPKTLAYDEVYEVPGCSFVFTGLTFQCWNVLLSGRAVTNYEAGVTISNLTTVAGAHLTFRAEWQTNSYEVVFLPNGAKGTMLNQKFRYGEEKPLTELGFVRGDPQLWSFAGWTNSAAGGPLYADRQVVSNLTTQADGRVELTAVWSSTIGELSIAMGCDNLKWEPVTSEDVGWKAWTTTWTNEEEIVSCAMSQNEGVYSAMETSGIVTNGTLRFRWKSTGGLQTVLVRVGSGQGTIHKTFQLVDESGTGDWQEEFSEYIDFGLEKPLLVRIYHQGSGVCYITDMTWTPDGSDKKPEYVDFDSPVKDFSMTDGYLGFSFEGDGISTYHLLGTNDLVAPMPWPMVFEIGKPSGSFSFEIPVKEDEPKMFYRIRALKQ